MPGSYAHITLSIEASSKIELKKIKNFPQEAIDAANLKSTYLELGSISPDYPYLDITSGDSKSWADAMHYKHTCKDIYVAAELIKKLGPGPMRLKCLAWLMGYTSHVVADMCVHPVVELLVGPYDDNKPAHRECEMHQDTYIYQRLGLGMTAANNHIQTTVMQCSDKGDKKRLDSDIRCLWLDVLKKVYKTDFQTNCPDLDLWHNRCNTLLESLLPITSNLMCIARHVANGLGLAYPSPEAVEDIYIKGLKVPKSIKGQSKLDYDAIFDYAKQKVQSVWLVVCRHALGIQDGIDFGDQEWNLDTGINVIAQNQTPIFWG
ncbi:MAG TPA: zinc dependent phospholipase C family protein [Dissulfurispiraceae bacterium]|nr:zinc dependent phospholipase C family protein [Dissulfurispiraceae bacterium]